VGKSKEGFSNFAFIKKKINGMLHPMEEWRSLEKGDASACVSYYVHLPKWTHRSPVPHNLVQQTPPPKGSAQDG